MRLLRRYSGPYALTHPVFLGLLVVRVAAPPASTTTDRQIRIGPGPVGVWGEREGEEFSPRR
jgi:hypothetical protein